MISTTMGTRVYGHDNANAIHSPGITTGNTPIAEIHTANGETAYVIFTGEEFPEFTSALANHIMHARNVSQSAYEFVSGEEI